MRFQTLHCGNTLHSSHTHTHTHTHVHTHIHTHTHTHTHTNTHTHKYVLNSPLKFPLRLPMSCKTHYPACHILASMIGVLASTGGLVRVEVTKRGHLLIWFGGVLRYQSVVWIFDIYGKVLEIDGPTVDINMVNEHIS